MSPQLPSNIDSVCDIIDYRLSIIMYFWCLPLFCCMYLCHCDGHLTETAARLPVAVHYRVSDLLNIIDFETTVSGLAVGVSVYCNNQYHFCLCSRKCSLTRSSVDVIACFAENGYIPGQSRLDVCSEITVGYGLTYWLRLVTRCSLWSVMKITITFIVVVVVVI